MTGTLSTFQRCVLFGGGGHARVVIDCLKLAGTVAPYAILDVDKTLWGSSILGIPIVGGDEKLPQLLEEDVTGFVVSVGSHGNNQPRRLLFEMALEAGLTPIMVRHPSAVISPFAEVGVGCQLLPASVVNAGAKLGINVIINSGAIVEHDCRLGNHVHVASGARLAGGVSVGREAHIGSGAAVLQGLSIGEVAVIGAGAVVINDVPPGATVVGVPAHLTNG